MPTACKVLATATANRGLDKGRDSNGRQFRRVKSKAKGPIYTRKSVGMVTTNCEFVSPRKVEEENEAAVDDGEDAAAVDGERAARRHEREGRAVRSRHGRHRRHGQGQAVPDAQEVNLTGRRQDGHFGHHQEEGNRAIQCHGGIRQRQELRWRHRQRAQWHEEPGQRAVPEDRRRRHRRQQGLVVPDATKAAPLVRLTTTAARWTGGEMPEDAMEAQEEAGKLIVKQLKANELQELDVEQEGQAPESGLGHEQQVRPLREVEERRGQEEHRRQRGREEQQGVHQQPEDLGLEQLRGFKIAAEFPETNIEQGKELKTIAEEGFHFDKRIEEEKEYLCNVLEQLEKVEEDMYLTKLMENKYLVKILEEIGQESHVLRQQGAQQEISAKAEDNSRQNIHVRGPKKEVDKTEELGMITAKTGAIPKKIKSKQSKPLEEVQEDLCNWVIRMCNRERRKAICKTYSERLRTKSMLSAETWQRTPVHDMQQSQVETEQWVYESTQNKSTKTRKCAKCQPNPREERQTRTCDERVGPFKSDPITLDEVTALQRETMAIKNAVEPRSKAELKTFLTHCSNVQPWLVKPLEEVRPLQELQKEGAEWEGGGLTDKAKEAFIKVKRLMPEMHIVFQKKERGSDQLELEQGGQAGELESQVERQLRRNQRRRR